jgi:hypothetical protein
MTTSVFVGCSYTEGTGFDLVKEDPGLWVNILHTKHQTLCKTKRINLGRSASSNSEIFLTAVKALFDFEPIAMFVQWSGYPRYRVKLGVETFNADQVFIPNAPCSDCKLHQINYTAEYLEKIRDRFLSLHHPHQGIVDIVEYTNTLIKAADKINTKIFFINGLCSWDKHYFDRLNNVLPSSYTKYTQKILNCESRDDSEIFTVYNMIHKDYQTAGTIQSQFWLNLYDSMRDNRIDTNNDNLHPGIKSNQFYADLFNQQLINKL